MMAAMHMYKTRKVMSRTFKQRQIGMERIIYKPC